MSYTYLNMLNILDYIVIKIIFMLIFCLYFVKIEKEKQLFI